MDSGASAMSPRHHSGARPEVTRPRPPARYRRRRAGSRPAPPTANGHQLPLLESGLDQHPLADEAGGQRHADQAEPARPRRPNMVSGMRRPRPSRSLDAGPSPGAARHAAERQEQPALGHEGVVEQVHDARGQPGLSRWRSRCRAPCSRPGRPRNRPACASRWSGRSPPIEAPTMATDGHDRARTSAGSAMVSTRRRGNRRRRTR